MRIRTKLVMVLLLVSLVPVAIMGLMAKQTAQGALEQQIGDSSLQFAKLAMRRINEHLYHVWEDVHDWSTMKVFAEGVTGHNHGGISTFLSNLVERHSGVFSYLAYVDQGGRIVAASDPSLSGAMVSNDQGFKRALAGEYDLQDVVYDELAQRYTLTISVPIRDGTDPSRVIGVLSCALDWQMVNKMILDLKVHGEKQTLLDHFNLLNKDGLVISCFYPDEIFKYNLVSLGVDYAKQVQQGRQGYVHAISEHGLPAFASYSPWEQHKDLPSLGWSLVLLQDPEALFLPVAKLGWVNTWTAIGTIICAVIGSFLLAYLISKPLEVVASAADRLAGGDRSARCGLGGEDEIGRLAVAFDGMACVVEETVSGLEEAVRKRTAVLEKEIAERKRAEEKIRQHEAEIAHVSRLSMMGEMATRLAHELNQPLAAISNYTSTCKRRILSGNWQSEQMLATLEKATKQAKRAGEIISRIRTFVRKTEPHRSTVDINTVVKDAVALIEYEAVRRRIPIRLALGEHLPCVLVDRVEISQVIVNLVRNGLESMEDANGIEAELTVRTSVSDGQVVEVAVCDRGCGFSVESTDQLFKPFYTTKPQGLGMGLAISRTIIEGHDGRLWVMPNPGRGTTFGFTLATVNGGHDD